MGKQSPKKPERERLDISLTTIFEGDSCEAVCINCPHLASMKIICLGEKLVALGYLLEDKERSQQRLDNYAKTICNLMYGRKL